MPSNSKVVCAICREVNKDCKHEKIYCGSRWAAPRKNNDKAWKLIAAGDIWWDKRRVERNLRSPIILPYENITHQDKLKYEQKMKDLSDHNRRLWLEYCGNAHTRTNRRYKTKRGK